MSEKKTTSKKVHTLTLEDQTKLAQANVKKMEQGKIEVMKVVEGVQGAEKLAELIERGKKNGKLSSSELMDVLENLDLESDQMDKIYDTLENLGIDTVGDDYLPELADDIMPPLEELNEIEELPEEEMVDPNTLVDSFGIDDPVRMYLKEIGKVNLLTPDEEIQLAQDMGAGDAAKEQMEELEQARREAAADARVRVEALENELAAARKQQSDLLNQHQEMDQKLKEARQARRDAMDAQKAAREELKQTREALERARKELRASGNKEITQFGVYFEACQEDFSRMMGILHKLKAGGDDEGRAKLTAAGGALLGAMEKQLAPFREEGAASC
mgnify:FL=1